MLYPYQSFGTLKQMSSESLQHPTIAITPLVLHLLQCLDPLLVSSQHPFHSTFGVEFKHASGHL